jgi:outer membrane protein assembly factor BamB
MWVAVAALAAVPVLACSGGDGSSVVTTTTADPLAGPALDRCGTDLSGLRTTVWALDPATGARRWRTEVPLADDYLLRSAAGNPQLPLVGRPVEVELDGATGAVVSRPPAGAHEVLVDPAGDGAGTAALLVDGERQPPTITVDGVRISTAAGSTGQTTVAVTATDASSGTPTWTVELGPADQIATMTPPVRYGDVVVVATSPPRPVESCVPQG